MKSLYKLSLLVIIVILLLGIALWGFQVSPDLEHEPTIIFKETFETGDYSHIGSTGGEAKVNWCALGKATGKEQVIQIGDAKLSVQSDNVFNGDYASRCEFLSPSDSCNESTRAEPARWKEPQQHDDLYYGCAYYIPNDFDTSGSMIVMQIFEAPSDPPLSKLDWNYHCLLHLSKRGTGQFVPRLAQRINRTVTRLWEDTAPIPLGQWFTMVIHQRFTQDGIIEFWVDDDLRVTLTGDYRTTHDKPGCGMKAGLYGKTSVATYIDIDDMTVATTYDEARPQRTS